LVPAQTPADSIQDRVKRKATEEYVRIQAVRLAKAQDEAERAKKRPKLMESILTPADLDDMPEVEHLIKGVLTQNSYGLLVGRDSTYKSFVALDWALCAATRTPWQGHEVQMPEDRPVVLYIASEGAYGMKPRIKAWLKEHGKTMDDLYQRYPEGSPNAREHPEGRALFHLMIRPVNLFEGPDAGEMVTLIRQHSRIGFVIVDTLRRSSGGAEQNGSDMGVVVDNLSRIKEATQGGSVLAIAHTDKNDNDTRGSSLVEDDADVVWHSRRPEGSRNADTVTLVNRKMKDCETHASIVLEPTAVAESLVMRMRDPFSSPGGEGDTTGRILDAVRLIELGGGSATAAEILRVVNESGAAVSKGWFYKSTAKLTEAGSLVKAGSVWTFPE
jgi:hypothetical protein